MCIIAAKPAGVNMPSYDTLRTMWNANNDGCGFMYVENGQVRIEKGFMKYKNFTKALQKVEQRLDLKATPMVFHFRITTHGGTSAENTHPFPITDNVKALTKPKMTTDVGVAHNGIIYSVSPRKGLSDTMEYVATQLAPLKRAVPDFYKSKDLRHMIENAIDSKMAFLTKDGRIYTIGEFHKDEGILYSNYSYCSYYGRYGHNFDWDSYYDDYYGFSSYSSKTTPELDAEKQPAATDVDYMYTDELMFLTEDDYVTDAEGILTDADEFAIDASGCVYRYVPALDAFEVAEGFTARNCLSGNICRFNGDEAFEGYIVMYNNV